MTGMAKSIIPEAPETIQAGILLVVTVCFTVAVVSTLLRWKKQLAVGVNASLRNSGPLKSPVFKRLDYFTNRVGFMW